MTDTTEDIFSNEMGAAKRLGSSIDRLLEVVPDDVREVTRRHLKLPREELSHSGAARALSNIAASLQGDYRGARQFSYETVRIWRERN